MRARGTLILLALVLGLGAYLLLVEQGRPTAGEQADQARRVVRVTAGDVDRVTITRGTDAKAETIRLQRDDQGQWRMNAPVAARADAGRAAGLATQLEFLESERHVENPDRAALGVDPPRVRAEFHTAGQTLTLNFGALDPTGRRAYLAQADQVHVADKGLLEALDQPAEAFRDRRALPFDSFRAQRVTLQPDGQGLTLARKSGGWILEAPQAKAEAADRQAVERLLERLAALRVERFLADTGEIEVQARITVTLEGGVERSLALGADVEGARQARLSDEPFIMSIKVADLQGLLRPDTGALKDRQLFHLDPAEVDRLVIGRGEQQIALQRTGEDWRVQGSERKADRHRVAERIRKLTALRADRVAPLAGDDATPAEVSRFAELSAGEQTERVTLVAWAGNKTSGKARLTRADQTAQLEMALDADSLFSIADKDFLSPLSERDHDHEHGHDHQH